MSTSFQIFIIVAYLANAVRYYRKSSGYPQMFGERWQQEKHRPMTNGEAVTLDGCYIISCLLWPLFGGGLKKYWKLRGE